MQGQGRKAADRKVCPACHPARQRLPLGRPKDAPMTTYSREKRLLAEGLGTAALVCTVVGSGIMADQLTDDTALALLGNTLPTGAILVVLITALGPVSGAHFNPAVSLALYMQRRITWRVFAGYVVFQFAGGFAGAMLAHAMFELPLIQQAATVRTGQGQWIAEGVATFGLVATILAGLRFRPEAIAWMVGLYITAAYWFTASTSFANPAVATGRMISDTFSGIRPMDVPPFIGAQIIGAVLAVAIFGWLIAQPEDQAKP